MPLRLIVTGNRKIAPELLQALAGTKTPFTIEHWGKGHHWCPACSTCVHFGPVEARELRDCLDCWKSLVLFVNDNGLCVTLCDGFRKS